MAKLNDIYVFVTDEQLSHGVQIPEHSVEKGLNITDYVRPNSIELSLTGEIVGKSMASIISKIKKMQRTGVLVKYIGRTSISKALISEFSAGYTPEISGGCTFSMSLKEIRTASSPYKSPKTKGTTKSGSQQVQSGGKKTRYHVVKSGESRYSISEKYKSRGCTIAYLTKNNNNASCLKQVGNWATLKVGAKMKVGVW